jgi:hypothetical protein
LPNAGLSEHIAVLSVSQDHSERLLTATPLQAASLLSDRQSPLAGATYIDIAGLLDLFAHWTTAAAQFTSATNPKTEEELKQIAILWEVWKVLRTYSSRTYQDSGAWITHSEWHIADLK